MNLIHGRTDRPRIGIMLAFAAMSLFSMQDALIKLLSGDYSLLQILFVRSATVIFPLFLFIYLKQGWSGFHTNRKQDHGIRVLYNFCAFLSYYFAVTRLPLANAVAISLSTPLFLTALSGPLLGEPSDLKRKLYMIIGFIGVLIVIRPDFAVTDWVGVGSALFGAFMFAMLAIQTRKMSATEETSLMVFYGVAVFFVVTGISMTFNWKPLNNADLGIMMILGVITFFAQYCIVHAYQYAAVYTIAPIEYVVIVWGIFFGWVFFNEIPSWLMLLGCVVIVVSGIGISVIEKRENTAKKTT